MEFNTNDIIDKPAPCPDLTPSFEIHPILQDKEFPFTISFDGCQINPPNSSAFITIHPEKLKINQENGHFVLVEDYYSESERTIASKLNGLDKYLSNTKTVLGASLGSELFTISQMTKTGEDKLFCLYSVIIKKFRISLKPDMIEVNKRIEDDLLYIATNPHKNFQDKVIDLDQKLKSYGYFIPLQMIIGGRFNISYEAKDKEEAKKFQSELNTMINKNLNFQIEDEKLDENKNFGKSSNFNILDSFDSLSTIYNCESIGGNSEGFESIDTIKRWFNSIKENNCEIIIYDNFQPLTDFLNNDIRYKIEPLLKSILDNQRVEAQKYIQTTRKIVSKSEITHGDCYEGRKIFSCGITDENNPSIKFKVHNIHQEKQIMKRTEEIICDKLSSNQKACGWKITSTRNITQYNGEWIILIDPLDGLRQEYSFKFTSRLWREMGFELKIYYTENI